MTDFAKKRGNQARVRKFPGEKGPRPDKAAQRRADAKERQAAYDARHPEKGRVRAD